MAGDQPPALPDPPHDRILDEVTFARILAAFLPIALAGCGASGRRLEARVVVGRANDAVILDPARTTNSESTEVAEQIFEHLVRYKPNSTEVEGSLATRWETSNDHRTWTFHLRRGVRFHDGTVFDADAVVFSFDRQRDAHHPNHESDFTYWESNFRNIQSVEKVDAYTVRILLARPYAPFLDNLTMHPVSIVSPTAVRRWGSRFGLHPVGTGPFRFVDWSAGERITLDANHAYWGKAPKVERLIYLVIHDPQQRLAALEGGLIDVAENLSPQDLQFVALHPELRLHRAAENNVVYLVMNVTHPPFTDVRVRRAVNYAVNKTAIVKLIYQGLAVEATTAVPPSMWGHVDEPLYSYDPGKARQLLGDARDIPRRGKLRLFTMETPRPYLPSPQTVAHVIQQNLNSVGLEVELVTSDWESHTRSLRNGEHDLALHGWSADNGDPDNFLYAHFDPENAQPGTARNYAFYRVPEVHQKLALGQQSDDRRQREAYYREIQDIIARDAPWVPLAHTKVVVAARVSLSGLIFQPSSTLLFDGVFIQ